MENNLKEVFVKEYIRLKKLKYKAIVSTYNKLGMEVLSQFYMYKKANELLEDEQVVALISIYDEENKTKELKTYKNEIIKTNKALWETLEKASTIENKLTKNGELIDGFYKFQDSNVVVATLQILARQSDEIRKEIEKLTENESDEKSDVITIEWK